MQRRDVRQWLWDVCRACDRIGGWVASRSESEYLTDELVQSAVERQFEIIGVALQEAMAADPSLSAELSDAKKAIQYRNFLAHAYDLVDQGKVREVALLSLPGLRMQAATALISRGGAPPSASA